MTAIIKKGFLTWTKPKDCGFPENMVMQKRPLTLTGEEALAGRHQSSTAHFLTKSSSRSTRIARGQVKFPLNDVKVHDVVDARELNK